MVMDRSKSNRPILAAYSSFARMPIGTIIPRISSVMTTFSFILDEVLLTNVLVHQGHVVYSLPGTGARAGCYLISLGRFGILMFLIFAS